MDKINHKTNCKINNVINHIIAALKEKQLDETAEILRRGNLTLHPAIEVISIHGSRGPKGGFRPDSDLDLSLILKKDINPTEELCSEALRLTLDNWQCKGETGKLCGGMEPGKRQDGEEPDSRQDGVETFNCCNEVKMDNRYDRAETESRNDEMETTGSHNEVELDCVIVFDKKGCGLKCFDGEEFDIEKFDKKICKDGTDCLGLYKRQRGFKGFVPDCGVKVEMMFPFVKVGVDEDMTGEKKESMGIHISFFYDSESISYPKIRPTGGFTEASGNNRNSF